MGSRTASVTEIYRRFKVVETLKGDAASGDTIFVVFTANFSWKLDDGQWRTEHYEVIPVSSGQEYVLFLKGTPRPDRYPAQYGDTVWGRVGEPSIAVIDPSGNLIFKSTERFKSESSTPGQFWVSVRVEQRPTPSARLVRVTSNCSEFVPRFPRSAGTSRSVLVGCRGAPPKPTTTAHCAIAPPALTLITYVTRISFVVPPKADRPLLP